MELQKRKDLKITCCSFESSLYTAIRNSNIDVYIELINAYPEFISQPLLNGHIEYVCCQGDFEILKFLLTVQTTNMNIIRCNHGKKIPKKVGGLMIELTHSHPVYKCFQHIGIWNAYVEQNNHCVDALMLYANKNDIIIDVPEEIAFFGLDVDDLNDCIEFKLGLNNRIKFMLDNNINYHLVVNKITRRLMREYYIDQIQPLIMSLIIPDLVGDIMRYF